MVVWSAKIKMIEDIDEKKCIPIRKIPKITPYKNRSFEWNDNSIYMYDQIHTNSWKNNTNLHVIINLNATFTDRFDLNLSLLLRPIADLNSQRKRRNQENYTQIWWIEWTISKVCASNEISNCNRYLYI